MSALAEDHVTVKEAAAFLRVAPSTIRRGLREGEVPAYRLGKRRVALRRADLSLLVTPARPREAPGHGLADEDELERIKRRKLTPEEVRRGLAALERARQHRKALLAQRGGVPFPDSAEIIRNMEV